MYLAGDYWRKHGQLSRSNLEFCLAGDVLFGVPFFVPPLQDAVNDYGIRVNFKTNLRAVDGATKLAFFSVTTADGGTSEVARPFDFLHVVPPQTALDFVKTVRCRTMPVGSMSTRRRFSIRNSRTSSASAMLPPHRTQRQPPQ